MTRHHRRQGPRSYRRFVVPGLAVAALLAVPLTAGATSTHPTAARHHRQAAAPVPHRSPAPSPSRPATASAPTGATSSAGGTLVNPMPGMNGLAVSVKVPAGSPGTGEMRVRPWDIKEKAGYDIGAFRVQCAYSHMAFDDPIVKPGQPGASHLHTFFGNTATNASSTPDSIATSGNSTCHGGIANRSAYWVPTVFDTRTGQPIAPDDEITYYKTGYAGVKADAVRPLPARLRMVAGNAASSKPQDFMGWGCLVGGSGKNPGGGIPTDCGTGASAVQMSVEFPQCWDGKNLDSADHKSHMAYPNAPTGCPADHPVPLPVITINVRYPVKAAGDTKFWKLSSDMYDTSAKPAGLSIHGDWMNGWNESIMQTWIDFCDHMRMSCSNALGDGREMY